MTKGKKDAIRNEVHDWVLELFKKGYKYQAITLLLATWNFAYFRYMLISFDLEKFKKDLEKLEKKQLAFFNGKTFKNIDLDDNDTTENIREIYATLSDSGIKQVGATKVMYLLKPEVFMMWDNGIISHYHKAYKKDKSVGKINKTADGYVSFMRLMQKLYKEGKFPQSKGNESITRTIDLYNWEKYRTGKIK